MTSNAFAYPPGLEKALLFILSYHYGRQKAIGRGALVWTINRSGKTVHERALRECIKQLRRQGHLICSMPGENGGYYMASNRAEFQEFDTEEFGAKISDMNETRQAMLRAARAQFGDAVQAVQTELI